MQDVLTLYKRIGLTPLQVIKQFQQQYPEYQKTKLSYAGRLDPMADGLLLVLIGKENKRRKQYEGLTKQYECSVLLGLETDTYDLLGKIIHLNSINNNQDIFKQVQELLPSFTGKQQQPYPPYSSQPVNGKPLYYWARKNKLSDIIIPAKTIEIYSIELLAQTKVTIDELKAIIKGRLNKVTGDFRQEDIKQLWNNYCENHKEIFYPIVKLRVSCSSGTYIRSLAHRLGKEVGTGAIALGITRTRIGEHTLDNALYISYTNLDAKC